MEPEWTKRIPSWAICDWFYMFFVINVFVLVALLLSMIYLGLSSAVPKTVKPLMAFMTVTNMLVSSTSLLFFYIMCDRSLRP